MAVWCFVFLGGLCIHDAVSCLEAWVLWLAVLWCFSWVVPMDSWCGMGSVFVIFPFLGVMVLSSGFCLWSVILKGYGFEFYWGFSASFLLFQLYGAHILAGSFDVSPSSVIAGFFWCF